MNQSDNNHPSKDRKKLIFKTIGFILVALLAWAAFNELVDTIASRANEKSSVSSTNNPHCGSPGNYKKRVEKAFSAYALARQALIKEIKMAKYVSSPPASAEYRMLNKADMTTARREDEFSKLARIKGTFQKNMSCHKGKDANVVKLYLYALTNLAVADNLLFQARGEISAKCNPKLGAYKPYIDAANQAVEMAKKDISGKIKAKDNADYIAKMPSELSKMKAIQDFCH